MSATRVHELCSYERHACSRTRYQKYKYCAQHVLEDTTSPFAPCQYVSRASGRKCPNPALRSKRANNSPIFCDEHLRELIVKEQHQKKKRKLRKKRKNQVASDPVSVKRRKLLKQLSKYADNPGNINEEKSSDSELEEAHRPVKDDWLLEQSGDLSTNADWDDFDPVNNEVYEPLRYADVLTPEEVVATAQSKLIRLQTLYMEQFKRLFHLLKEGRRRYLHDSKKELKEEKAGTSRSQDGTFTFDEEEIYALATYRKRFGVEALLRRRQFKKRQDADASTSNFSTASKPLPVSRCSHVSNHTRCKGNCLPYTKYCTSHILEDPHQQMYRKCHMEDCPIPVCYLTTYPYEVKAEGDDTECVEVCYCIVHAPLPDMNIDFEKWKELTEEVEVDVEGSAEVSNVQEHAADSPHQGFNDAMEVENSHTEMKAVPNTQHNTQNMGISEDVGQKVEESSLAEINSPTCPSGTVSPPVNPNSETDELKIACEMQMAVPNASVAEPAMESLPPVTMDTQELKPEVARLPTSNQTDSSSTQLVKDVTESQDTQPISELEKEFPSEIGSDKTNTQPQSSLAEQEKDTVTVLSTVDDSDVGSSSHAKTDTPDSLTVISQKKHGNSTSEPRMLLDPVTGVLRSEDQDDVEPAKPEISSSSEEIAEDDPPVISTVPSSSALPTTPTYLGRRGERKPSSADEQMAVVSLLALCSGHPSDDNTPSSSAEQE